MHLFVIAFLMACLSPPDLFAAGGDLDTTFEPVAGANGEVRAVALQPDGKIVIGGAFTSYDPAPGTLQNRITRLNPNGTRDTTFNNLGFGANDTVYAIALQSDGKIIIGGAFTTCESTTRVRIARLNANGSLDTTFDPGGGATSASPFPEVRAIAIQADNKIIIAGAFTSYNGTPRNRIARLNTDGSLDTTFDPGTGASNSVFAAAVQPDGKIIIAGAFMNYNNSAPARIRIARLNPSGSLDTSFVPGEGAEDGNVFAVAVQLDNKIIIGGLFSTYHNVSRNGIARINTDGSLDTTFDPGSGATSVHSIAVQPGGKVIIGSSFVSYNGVARSGIARINTNGSLDTTFDPGTGTNVGSFVYAIAVQPDGRIVIGGSFINYNGVTRNRVARLLPAPGALSFSASANSVNEQAGNATIALTRTGGTDNSATARATITDGTTSPADYIFAPGVLDTTFDVGTGIAQRSLFAIAVQPDGKIIIAGDLLVYNGVSRIGLARLNANGSLDTTFNPGNSTGLNGRVFALAVQPDGKIIIGGEFTDYQSFPRNRIARLNANGSLDATFDPGTGFDASVNAIALQADGKIIVGGDFVFFRDALRITIARLNADGSLDTTFQAGEGPNGFVRTIAIQADGKILIAGDFFKYSNVGRNRIARINPNGLLDTTFDPGAGADGDAYALAIQADGKIIIGGEFTTFNGTARKSIAGLNTNGSLDMTFDPGTGANQSLRAIRVQPDGKVIIGGFFTTYNDVARSRLARLNANGSLDTTFDASPGAGGVVRAMALQANGKIVIGGAFTTYDNVERKSIAGVNGDLFVNWPAGDATDKSIQLPIVDDAASEGNETLTLTLTSLTGGATNGANSTQTLTIIDNDAAPTPTPTPSGTPTPTPTGTPTPTPTATPGLVANVSTRLQVGKDDDALFEGFIIQGPAGSTKKIIVRALGPFLAGFGVADPLANPTLDIFEGSNRVAMNNDWRTTQPGGLITADQSTEIAASGFAPSDDLESAIIANLAPGAYTAVVRGLGNSAGIGLGDAFDLSASSSAKVVNVATRGLVQPGDKLLTAGFIIQNGSVRAVIRAIGPSLSAFNISNALPDTTLQLRDQNGNLMQENDDWETDQKPELEMTGLQPSNSKEAALVRTIPPGQYTAQVRGKPETTGIGVVEVYFID